MSSWGWVALGLGIFDLLLWAVVIVCARLLYRRVRPQVEPYLSMAAGMFGSAAGTGDVENTAASSPAAAAVTPDRCEYDDHEWSYPWYDTDSPTDWHHACMRCGYVEPIPSP